MTQGDMDAIDWIVRLVDEIRELYASAGPRRVHGIHESAIAISLWGEETYQANYDGTTRKRAIVETLEMIEWENLVEESLGFYKPGAHARGQEFDLTSIWAEMLSDGLTPQQEAVLAKIVELSTVHEDNFVYLSHVDGHGLAAALEETTDREELSALVGELDEHHGMVRSTMLADFEFNCRPTYRGLVQVLRKDVTRESIILDHLVEQWETTSVEFKREVHTNTADEKAELVKDTVALVNTQASGQRLLIIGFDPKTREWYGAPDSKLSRDHLEQLVSAYIDPVPVLRYEIVAYKTAGPVGWLEFIREKHKLPYKVKRDIKGQRHRVIAGEVYVRHGSQVTRLQAGDPELAAIEFEGERARTQEHSRD